MKERPILMHARSINGILEGRKTQTRRIIKPQPDAHLDPALVVAAWDAGFIDEKCPYGKRLDRLWVRESGWLDKSEKRFFAYKASPGICKVADTGEFLNTLPEKVTPESMAASYKSVPSIHMPRWASRITLEVTGIRVERVRDLTQEDAKAEGCNGGCVHCGELQPCGCATPRPDYRDSFVGLWNDTNGPGAWERNDWVWCVEFRRLP